MTNLPPSPRKVRIAVLGLAGIALLSTLVVTLVVIRLLTEPSWALGLAQRTLHSQLLVSAVSVVAFVILAVLLWRRHEAARITAIVLLSIATGFYALFAAFGIMAYTQGDRIMFPEVMPVELSYFLAIPNAALAITLLVLLTRPEVRAWYRPHRPARAIPTSQSEISDTR